MKFEFNSITFEFMKFYFFLFNKSPLIMAVEKEDIQIVKLLLDKKVDLNFKSKISDKIINFILS